MQFAAVTLEHGKSILIPTRLIKEFYIKEHAARLDPTYSLQALRKYPELDESGPTILCVDSKEELEQLYPKPMP